VCLEFSNRPPDQVPISCVANVAKWIASRLVGRNEFPGEALCDLGDRNKLGKRFVVSIEINQQALRILHLCDLTIFLNNTYA
jgi:hypothetical protein